MATQIGTRSNHPMDFHHSRHLTIQSQNGTKNCGLLLVGPKRFVYFSILPCYFVGLTNLAQKLIAKGKAESEYLVCLPNFRCSVSVNSFDTADRLRALTLTIWFFSAKLSGIVSRRDIESLKYSAELGRNTGGPLDSKLKKLSE